MYAPPAAVLLTAADSRPERLEASPLLQGHCVNDCSNHAPRTRNADHGPCLSFQRGTPRLVSSTKALDEPPACDTRCVGWHFRGMAVLPRHTAALDVSSFAAAISIKCLSAGGIKSRLASNPNCVSKFRPLPSAKIKSRLFWDALGNFGESFLQASL